MKPGIIGIGLCLIGAGALLSLVGHYDGILGADDPETFLAQDKTPQAKVRVTVLGSPDEAQDRFLRYGKELLIPANMDEPLRTGTWVAVQLYDTEAEAYLRINGEAPEPGTLLVFTGTIGTYWPILDAGTDVVAGQPVLLLEPVDYHAPLFFKS